MSIPLHDTSLRVAGGAGGAGGVPMTDVRGVVLPHPGSPDHGYHVESALWARTGPTKPASATLATSAVEKRRLTVHPPWLLV